MKLESQVVSLDLAKQLKELGVKQESLFCWTTDLDLEFLPSEIRNNNVCIAAFTVAELLNILPDYFCTYRNKGKYRIGYDPSWCGGMIKFTSQCANAADSLATLLIHLLEQGLINVVV